MLDWIPTTPGPGVAEASPGVGGPVNGGRRSARRVGCPAPRGPGWCSTEAGGRSQKARRRILGQRRGPRGSPEQTGKGVGERIGPPVRGESRIPEASEWYCVIPFLLPPPKNPCPARAKKASQAGRRRF